MVVLGLHAELTGQALVEHSTAGLERLVQWLKQIDEPSKITCIIETALFKRCRHPRPNEVAQKIPSLARQPQLRTSPIFTRAKTRLMLAIVAQLAPLGEAIRAYDREIEQSFRAILTSQSSRAFPG